MRIYQQLNDLKKFKYPSVYSLLLQRVIETPDKEFITSLHNESKEDLTYSQFLDRVIKVRKYFESRGGKTTRAITLIMPNSVDFLVIQYAARSLGLLVVPVNFNFSSREIAYIINDCGSELIIFDLEYLAKINDLGPLLSSKPDFLFLSRCEKETAGYGNIYEVYANNATVEKEPPVDYANLDTKALVIYTSGTSGNPKGCVLTHRNMLADAEAIAAWFRFDTNTRTLCLLPLFHNNGQIPTFLAPLWVGGATVFSSKSINFIEFWDLVYNHSITWSSVIPTILTVLLGLPGERKDSTMQGIICGGALLPTSIQE